MIGKVIDGKKSKQTSDLSKGATGSRHGHFHMLQNVFLVWLDNNIDEENDEDCYHTITQLRSVIDNINTFTASDQCIDFINGIKYEKICMIISGSLGQEIVPIVHNMSQVDSIFIFCGNKKRHEQWAKEWPKIRGVFVEILPICEALKQAVQECEHNAMTMSFVSTNGGASGQNLDQLDSSFMYTQILKEILLAIQFEEHHIKEFTNYCCEQFVDNDRELNNIKKLERKYREKTPIWWYTYECFLYPMLNRALRMMELDIIIKMGFFIADLHRDIKRLHAEQFGDSHFKHPFIVYRGQGLSKTDFNQMMQTKGGLMSFNNFLSTSKDRNVSLTFVHRIPFDRDIFAILFVMTIDPSISSTPFASITNVSYCKDAEDEVLFSMHTVFRIRDIKSMSENNHLWQVELTLTSDNDQELCVLTERIREETYPSLRGWERLGLLLLQMGQWDKAQQVYEVMLEQASDLREKAPIYNQLGRTKRGQEKYEEAITYYKKSLEIKQKSLHANHPHLASSWNNIGNVYQQMGDHSKALLSYEEALQIQQKSLPPNHPDLAKSYNNIGLVYDKIGEYSKALSSHERALEMRQQTLPSNHHDLGYSYHNIGNVYYKTGDYTKAISFYERAVDIGQRSLPSNHPDLQKWRKNFEDVKKL